jgi:hypothetical protein
VGVTNRNESNWKLSTKEEKETQLKTKNLKKRPKLVIRIALNKNKEYIYLCKSRKILFFIKLPYSRGGEMAYCLIIAY